MLYLHVSNRTENLLNHLVHVFRASERRDLFEKEYFLIQSQGMERMISQTLAENFTSWCNFEYFLPLAFLQYSAGKLGMEITPDAYERKIMIWRLEELLRDLNGDEYQPLKLYLTGDNLELKRYQLADQLANIFDQYQVMRVEMLAGWADNRLSTDDPSEIWQRALWLRLISQYAGSPHRGVVLQQVVDELNKRNDLSELLPERVSVFGLSIMPPLFLHYLQGLALHSDVHLYVLSPCREYWGESESRRRALLRSLNASSTSAEGSNEAFESHPLLVSLGQQGRDFQRMLFDDVRFELEFDSYEDPLESGPDTLLRQLQSDLLRGEATQFMAKWPEEDRSIRIVSCHSKLREIAILKDHILQWLYDDPELELRDIVVMAPDIQEYSALIPALFDDIQHSVSDRSLRRRNSVLSAFDSFLKLLRGRFGWDELLDLLKEQAIADKLQLSQADLENIQQWVTQSGIRWGLSAEQRGSMGLPDFKECSWEAGLERLLMGYAIDSEDMVDDVLPFQDIEGGGASSLGALCQFVSMVENARREFQSSHSLVQWSDLLVQHARELFYDESGYGDSKDFLELQEILQNLGEEQGVFHQSEVDFSVICTWLEHTARETRSSSGFLRGQLTFCSMLPMRSIPFKVVCLIGLNDGLFPKNDRYATFDLMGSSHKPGDRSRRMDDRYQFLEALIAARDILYLSYIGQSIKNNDEIPPSVVVTELLEVLKDSYKVEGLVVNHPLHPFSRSYFDGKDPNLFSYDSSYCKVAEAITQRSINEKVWWNGTREVEIDEIELSDFFRFYMHPQRWFVRNCLGIWLSDDVDVIGEQESFQPKGLDSYLIDQELVSELLAGKGEQDLKKVHRKLCICGLWPLGVPGELEFTKKVDELRGFARTIAMADMGERLDDISIDLEVAGYTLRGRLTNIYENGIMVSRYSKLKGKDVVHGWLHHLLYARATGESVRTRMFANDGHREFAEDCQLFPDLEVLVDYFVAGCSRPSPLYIEPGMAWVKKAVKNPVAAQEAAVSSLSRILEAGYDRELDLLLRNAVLEDLLGEEFVSVCQNVLQPVWSNAHGT